jgi:hypothetical protein
VHHVVQNNLWNEFGFKTLIGALETHEVPYTIVNIIPFVHKLDPDIHPEGNVMVWGATTLGHIAVEKGWKPGRFQNENFDMRKLHEVYGSYLLNSDAKFCTLEEMRFDTPMFCRPVHDSKSFSGVVLTPEELETWKQQVIDVSDGFSTLRPETPVMYAAPKDIELEARFFIIDGKVISGSTYRTLGRQIMYQRVDSTNPLFHPMIEFAQSMAGFWGQGLSFSSEGPDKAWVLDVAQIDGKNKVVEINTINSAGFYATDMDAVVKALENLYS